MSSEYQKQYYIDKIKSKGLITCNLCGKSVQHKRLEYHIKTNLCFNNRDSCKKINKIKIEKNKNIIYF